MTSRLDGRQRRSAWRRLVGAPRRWHDLEGPAHCLREAQSSDGGRHDQPERERADRLRDAKRGHQGTPFVEQARGRPGQRSGRPAAGRASAQVSAHLPTCGRRHEEAGVRGARTRLVWSVGPAERYVGTAAARAPRAPRTAAATDRSAVCDHGHADADTSRTTPSSSPRAYRAVARTSSKASQLR